MNDTEKFSTKKRAKSFVYAFKGLAYIFKTQHNFYIHLAISISVIFAAVILKISQLEWLVIIGFMGLVLSAEAFNTAIEKMVDKLSPKKNRDAGIVKDVAAGAVLLASISAAVAGLIIFVPKIINTVLCL